MSKEHKTHAISPLGYVSHEMRTAHHHSRICQICCGNLIAGRHLTGFPFCTSFLLISWNISAHCRSMCTLRAVAFRGLPTGQVGKWLAETRRLWHDKTFVAQHNNFHKSSSERSSFAKWHRLLASRPRVRRLETRRSTFMYRSCLNSL